MRANIVSDTSCLIILEKLAALDVLKFLHDQIIITSTIAQEYGKALPDWIIIRDPVNLENISKYVGLVDMGEATAICLALELENSFLIVDDLPARTLALSLGINFTGTLGLLLNAKSNGYYSALKPILNLIKNETNFRISDKVINQTLSDAGEL